MKKRLFFLATFLLTLLYGVTFAQERTVSGTVTGESGDTLPGATVQIKGTTTGVVTDLDGKYKIELPADATTLVVSFVGMDNKEVEIGNQSVIDVVMSDALELTEVVVTGYQSFVKEKVSISAETVSAESIGSRPNTNFMQSLGGQVAGLNITTNSGQPGRAPVVQLRGVNSINGDTEPLYIIDGAPSDALSFAGINAQEIESVTVLKDAGATAIYGNRGANGVILITTKQGGYNAPLQIDYTYMLSTNSLQTNDYDLMNSQQQLALEKEYGRGRGAGMTDAEIAAATNTDWLDVFFRNSTVHSHNLQFRKGGERSSTYLSLGFSDIEGILENSSLRRYNLRSNTTGKSKNDKLNYGLNLSVNYTESEDPNSIGSGAINRNYVLGANQSVPYISPDDYTNGRDLLSPLSFTNTPLFLVDRLKTYNFDEKVLKMLGSFNVSYAINDNFTVKMRTSADFTQENRVRAQGPESFNSLLFADRDPVTGERDPTPGFQQHNYSQSLLFNQVASINYSKVFDKHTIGVGLFTEYFKAHRYRYGFFQNGLDPKTFALGSGDGTAFVADNAANDWHAASNIFADNNSAGLFSYFGSVDYDYDTRFGVNAVLRRDASSRFAESNRWGTFYSVSGRWNIHNEVFAENLPFNLLKLRTSYGVTGNQDIVGTGYYGGLTLTTSLFAPGAGYGGQNSYALSGIGNTDLRWEKVAQANIGVDAELLDGRLRTSFDFYSKTTTDLFIQAPVSSVNDAPRVNLDDSPIININIGELKNTGFDFNVSYDILRQADGLTLTVGVLGNYNKQKIVALAPGQEELIGTGRVGGPLFEQFTIRYAGVNPDNGNLLYYTADGETTETPNADTDRVWTGKNIFPDLQGGMTLSADYKGLYLGLQFNYTTGRYRYDFDLAGYQDPTAIGQFRSSTDLLNAWTPENTNTDVPRLGVSNAGFTSDRYLTKADFVRLRFINLGYNIPAKYLEKVGVRTASVFVNASNLITFTNWRGFDVEAAPGIGNEDKDNAVTTSANLYPTPRTFSVGLKVGF